MNERDLIGKIKQDLNYGTGRLKSQVTDRLRKSRECALEAFAAQSQTEHAYAFAGHHGHGHPFANRKWMPIAFLTLLLIGVFYWQQQELMHDDNIDVALLSSELPLSVFIVLAMNENFDR